MNLNLENNQEILKAEDIEKLIAKLGFKYIISFNSHTDEDYGLEGFLQRNGTLTVTRYAKDLEHALQAAKDIGTLLIDNAHGKEHIVDKEEGDLRFFFEEALRNFEEEKAEINSHSLCSGNQDYLLAYRLI